LYLSFQYAPAGAPGGIAAHSIAYIYITAAFVFLMTPHAKRQRERIGARDKETKRERKREKERERERDQREGVSQ